MLFHCWPNVFDTGPTLKQYRLIAMCLLDPSARPLWQDAVEILYFCRAHTYTHNITVPISSTKLKIK